MRNNKPIIAYGTENQLHNAAICSISKACHYNFLPRLLRQWNRTWMVSFRGFSRHKNSNFICQPTNRCGTHITNWINGGHPSVADGQVSRTVCFYWTAGCCEFSTNIKVRNCGSYYVYYQWRTSLLPV